MSNDQRELEKYLKSCLAIIAATNEAKFIAAKMSDEDIEKELQRTIGKRYFQKRARFSAAFLHQFDIEFMTRVRTEDLKQFGYDARIKYYDLLDRILLIPNALDFVNEHPLFVDTFKTGVIKFSHLFNKPSKILALILTPACITALQQSIISIHHLKNNPHIILESLLQPNSLEALTSNGQSYQKFFIELEQNKTSFSSRSLAMICTAESIKAIFSLLINFETLRDVQQKFPNRLQYLLSSEILAVYGTNKYFDFKTLKDYPSCDLEILCLLLTAPGFLTVVLSESCDVDFKFILKTIMINHHKSSRMFSEEGANAITQEKLSIRKLSAMSEETLFFVLSASNARCFGILIHNGIFNHSDNIYTSSKKDLERMLNPAYVECCLKLKKSGVLDDLPENERDTNPVAYGLLKHINFDALMTEISRVKARFHEKDKASRAKKTASETLERGFHDARQRFVDSVDPLKDYAQLLEACKTVICQSKPELAKHRGWKKIGADLINFMIACINLILPLGFRFNLFDNKAISLQQIESLERTIEHIPLPHCT